MELFCRNGQTGKSELGLGIMRRDGTLSEMFLYDGILII